MKIAYFNADLRKGQDGVSRYLYKVIENAINRNHKAIAITSNSSYDLEKIIPTYTIPSIPIPMQKTYKVALPGYKSFINILTDFQPDIIHINSPCTLGFAAMKYSRKFKVPAVATYHTHFPTYLKYYKLEKLEKLSWNIFRGFYNRLDSTFVPTLPILEDLRLHKFRNIEYLANGVDLNLFNIEFYSKNRRKYLSPQNKPVLLFVGRLVWEKDLIILAKVYEILKQRRNDFEMVIVGDGHARHELECMMKGAKFIGFQSGIDLSEIYASSDIFVFPSTTETFGLVTIEAMASGLAPVAAKMGGAIGIIEEGVSGFLTKPLDPDEMVQKIELLLNNPELRIKMSLKAVDRAQNFNWNRILDQIFKRYKEIIEEYWKKRLVKAA